MRKVWPIATLLLIAGVVVVLVTSGHGTTKPVSSAGPVAAQQAALRGAPAALAALHARASEVVDGDRKSFAAMLRSLRGHPVVVNKWASWCGPCRYEFPFLQSEALARGKRVAFLGLNSGDNRADALRFLRRFPVSYPSVEDPHEAIARSIGAALGYPTMIFYDARGKRLYVHQGAYASRAAFAADLDRYARPA